MRKTLLMVFVAIFSLGNIHGENPVSPGYENTQGNNDGYAGWLIITGDAVIKRKGPGTEYKDSQFRAYKNQTYKWTSHKDGWYELYSESGQETYISDEYAREVSQDEGAGYVVCTASDVVLRMTPNGKDSGIRIQEDMGMKYTGQSGEWYKVRYEAKDYYIASRFCRLEGKPLPKEVQDLSSENLLKSNKVKITGKHLVSLQWISWDDFGQVNITKTDDGRLFCKGGQTSKEDDGNYLKIEGYITIVSPEHLILDGFVETRVDFNNGGEPCRKEGALDFISTQNRKYWRMQQMRNCEGSIDYVDIYFK